MMTFRIPRTLTVLLVAFLICCLIATPVTSAELEGSYENEKVMFATYIYDQYTGYLYNGHVTATLMGQTHATNNGMVSFSIPYSELTKEKNVIERLTFSDSNIPNKVVNFVIDKYRLYYTETIWV